MSVMDGGLEFSDAQALASVSSGASVKSTNIPDLAASHIDGWDNAKSPELGNSVLNTVVNTVLVGAGDVRVQLVSKAADASISSGATVHEELRIPTISAVGTRRSLKVTPGTEFNRYVGLLYLADGGGITSGAFNSWLGLDAEKPG